MDKLIIFDTTLRDGEQSPGASLNPSEKVKIARQLAALGVDVIEAGFPVASPDDFEAVHRVAKEVRRAVVCGLARCLEKDIRRAAEALKPARRGRLHVFLATSKIHRRHKLRKARSEILRLAVRGVKLARKFTDDVEFSPEDASRTEPDFLCQVVEAVIKAGATTVNIPDTVGYATPADFGSLIGVLMSQVPNVDRAVISVHCHNDLGLAVANSLAAIEAGARQVECTINGLGERAGNAALEELVMAVRTRQDHFPVTTRIKTPRIIATSRMVSNLTGMLIQRNKAIVGENAFAHEAGIHQDGVLKERTTYEIMRPEDVGLTQSQLVLGKHSGRHALRARVKALGFKLTDGQINEVFEEFKILADKKKEIFDEDLLALVEGVVAEVPEVFRLVGLHTSSGMGTIPTATVEIRKPDRSVERDAATGDGPVDAIYRAVDRITQLPGKLLDYHIRAITRGRDAMGEVSLRMECAGQVVSGRASNTDILQASAEAYLHAVNKAAAQADRIPE